MSRRAPPSLEAMCACSSGGFIHGAVATFDVGFEHCCNLHDICYGSVNSVWKDCNNMQYVCEFPLGDTRALINKAAVDSVKGWDAFRAAQRASVKCV